MALPLVGVGLLYRKGYLRQLLTADGWQQEEYPEIEFCNLPIERARGPEGEEVSVTLNGPDGQWRAFVWKLHIGRTILYLLDSNLLENPPAARKITARLCAGEPRIRLAQEVLLGIGGMRALSLMGVFPSVCHMNEGHSAFSTLEQLALFMQRFHVDLETATQMDRRCTVFTNHTPVPAGHDSFSAELVLPYLRPLADQLGVDAEHLLAWGQHPNAAHDAPFSMFTLGINFAGYCNEVSRLHGETARRMWAHLWPGCPDDEVPIDHITNGVHVSTFLAPEISPIFEHHLGPEWYMSSRRPKNIQRLDDIYDDELWRAHEMTRTRLVRTGREMMRRQYERRNAPKRIISEVESVLNPEVLTIAIARRFASYKRAALLLHDPDRLEQRIASTLQSVQFVFAGKAHPNDNEGKELIKRIIQFARRPGVRQRFVFIEDYDMRLSRCLVQGADVWLNTPRRPYEACGTSGMKAAVNGVLNLSILDGWWNEGFNPQCGWAIGRAEEYKDPDFQDAVESQALYNTLENEVVPCFYEARNGDLPLCWIHMMKASMKMAIHQYCSLRMLGEYERRCYIPIAQRLAELTSREASEARLLAAKVKRLQALWSEIRIGTPVPSCKGPFRIGENFKVQAEIHLGELEPAEICVQLYNGHMRSTDDLREIRSLPMQVASRRGQGRYLFSCPVPCLVSGRYGFSVRVIPEGDECLKRIPGLMAWY